MSTSIKALTAKLRLEREAPIVPNEQIVVAEIPILPKKEISTKPEINKEAHSSPIEQTSSFGFDNVLEVIRTEKVQGKTKMLIRIDDRHTSLLNHFKILNLNVTQFINYLIKDFSATNPEIKATIKNSLKNSLKDL